MWVYESIPGLLANKILSSWNGAVSCSLLWRLESCRGFTHCNKIIKASSVQFRSSVVSNSWTAACQGFPVHHQFLELAQIHVHQVSDTILCCFLLLLPSIFPSIRVFSKESVLHIRCPKYWSFSVSTSPSNEYSGLISFRIDWLNLLVVQGTLKSLLQYHSSKVSEFTAKFLRFLHF